MPSSKRSRKPRGYPSAWPKPESGLLGGINAIDIAIGEAALASASTQERRLISLQFKIQTETLPDVMAVRPRDYAQRATVPTLPRNATR